MVWGFKSLLPYTTKNCIFCADIVKINQMQRGFRVFETELAKIQRLKKTEEESSMNGRKEYQTRLLVFPFPGFISLF